MVYRRQILSTVYSRYTCLILSVFRYQNLTSCKQRRSVGYRQTLADPNHWNNVCDKANIRVVVSTAAFHARVRGSDSGLSGLQETMSRAGRDAVKLWILFR